MSFGECLGVCVEKKESLSENFVPLHFQAFRSYSFFFYSPCVSKENEPIEMMSKEKIDQLNFEMQNQRHAAG